MSESDEDSFDKDSIQAGSAEFNTVKAGCGIRFDPDILNDEAGFDFSAAEKILAEDSKK